MNEQVGEKAGWNGMWILRKFQMDAHTGIMIW